MLFVVDRIFFFQAEDGIRDFHVTGVQTCALPISMACMSRPHSLGTADWKPGCGCCPPRGDARRRAGDPAPRVGPPELRAPANRCASSAQPLKPTDIDRSPAHAATG